jgi:histidyl-tRNA synthetase
MIARWCPAAVFEEIAMNEIKIKPRLPKGMRDFLPQEMLKREYVFGIVREVFHLYGFEPLQTPVLELNETLMGKYGEDAEKLIFQAQHPGGKEQLALRYDLTVPLARVVAQYPNDISLPFKRYQLSPVWRAERCSEGATANFSSATRHRRNRQHECRRRSP